MKLINTIVMVPIYLALVILLIGSNAISLDRTVVTVGRFIGIIFQTIDEMTSPDAPPLPTDRNQD